MNAEIVEMAMAVQDAGETGERGGLEAMAQEIAWAAQSDLCVLLTGLPATVQDLAYRLHTVSGWRHGEFLIIDCAHNADLIEALFEIPIDDAPKRPGVQGLRLVQAGSVLLHEVGRLSPAVQTRLAHGLAVMRVARGYGRSRWRVISSSSESLVERVRDGSFSGELFYRLNMIHFDVPPV